MTKVTEQQYDYAYEVLPPIFFCFLDGEKQYGFAVSEPLTHTEGGEPVFQCYLTKKNGDSKKEYFTFEGVVRKFNPDEGNLKPLSDYNDAEYTRDNVALSIENHPELNKSIYGNKIC